MSQPPLIENPPRRAFNPRIVLLLVVLIVVISATVIATDYYSRTQGPRSPAPQHINFDKGTLP